MDFAHAVIPIQPGTVREPYRFVFPRHSAVGANDGNLPFGFEPTAVTIRVTDLATGLDLAAPALAALIPTDPALDEDADDQPVVDVDFSWPGAPGQYQLEFRLTDGIRTLPRDFRLVLCAER